MLFQALLLIGLVSQTCLIAENENFVNKVWTEDSWNDCAYL